MAPSAKRQGLAEYAAVIALLALAAAGAVALFRGPIRSLFGEPHARAARPARAAPPAGPAR